MPVLGPLFRHELVWIARRQRLTLWRTTYALCLVAAAALVYAAATEGFAKPLPRHRLFLVTQWLLVGLMLLQFVLGAALVPRWTADVVAGFDDPRVRLVRSPANRGYVRTFEAAIRQSSGEAVLLADQDDVWLPRHVEVLVDALQEHRVAASNLRVLGTGAGLQGPSGKPGWELRAADS